MYIYHYSDTNIKNKIDPKFYGYNYFTRNDCNITGLKRAFFYTKPQAEYLLSSSHYLYISQVKKASIYDLSADRKGYIKKYQGNIDKALRAIKRDYIGVKYNIGYDIINLFKAIKINKRLTLTTGNKYVKI